MHGISGFHDHIVTHAAVTRVYLELRGLEHPWLQRLAFFTVVAAPATFPWHVNITKPEEIDCAFDASEADMERFHKALECYVTYAAGVDYGERDRITSSETSLSNGRIIASAAQPRANGRSTAARFPPSVALVGCA